MYNDYFGFRVAPFSSTPDPDLYYQNPVYEEAFATLHYGVTAKKGFIVITGEVGTGKTTLLHKLLRHVGPTVHSVFIFNTQVKFDGLLRFILMDLGLTPRANDRPTMIETLNHYLIERLIEGHTVCLLIDEAQNLCDDTLEGLRLLSNLETDKEKLLQIVLIGQPELEKKLDQSGLRQLKQRVVLHCRLVPLKKTEVGPYIDSRIKAAGYQKTSLFPPETVERIANYSEGIPRLINILCDNALLTAYADSQKEVSAQMITEVALDLRLLERTQIQIRPTESPILRERSAVSADVQVKIVPDEVWQSRLGRSNIPAGLEIAPAGQPKKSWAGLRVGALLALVLVSSGGAFEYSESVRSYLSNLGHGLQGFVEDRPAESVARPQQQESQDSSAQPDAPTSSAQPVLSEEHHWEVRPIPERNNSGTFQASLPTDNVTTGDPSDLGDKTKRAAKEQPQVRVSKDPSTQKEKIEVAIRKAIQNRAISGVTVSLIDGTAYLGGKVATESQKSMAERAARSVPEVKDVRNRLEVP